MDAPSPLGYFVRVLDKGHVALMDVMGNDLTVANAARVSFGKRAEWRPSGSVEDYPGVVYQNINGRPVNLDVKDHNLIRYLARHNHWTPFGHVQLSFCMKMPLFVRNQFMRSTVGVVYTEDGEFVPFGSAYEEQDPVINEISRRYVDEPPEFYEPSEWRGRPEKSMKQGSAGTVCYTPAFFATRIDGVTKTDGHTAQQAAHEEYAIRLQAGVAPEQARICLPICAYTEFWATMSLAAAVRIFTLRADPHAQWEVRQYAAALQGLIAPRFPVAWGMLTTKENRT